MIRKTVSGILGKHRGKTILQHNREGRDRTASRDWDELVELGGMLGSL